MNSIEKLNELLRYEPETGLIYWRVSLKGGRATAGAVAGYMNCRGYIKITVGGKCLLAHRVAFALTRGWWPENEIDHINGIKSDNRIINLREATKRQNEANKGVSKSSCTGLKGVSFRKSRNKFVARISNGEKRRFLGLFDTAQEAHEAYCKAAKEMHGEFAWGASWPLAE